MMNFDSLEQMNSILIRCKKCPRLVKFREEVALRKSRYLGEKFWSKPVPGFGNINAKLLVLGLAPAATGGNRTGRVFTGDKSASFLFSCLYDTGLSNMADSVSVDDGLVVEGLYITAALKCVPPNDKPAPNEMRNCEEYRYFEIRAMKNLRAVLLLGRIAFDAFKAYLKKNGKDVSGLRFSHGGTFMVDGVTVYSSYHPSPRNVNTGRIRKKDMVSLLERIKKDSLSG